MFDDGKLLITDSFFPKSSPCQKSFKILKDCYMRLRILGGENNILKTYPYVIGAFVIELLKVLIYEVTN